MNGFEMFSETLLLSLMDKARQDVDRLSTELTAARAVLNSVTDELIRRNIGPCPEVLS